MLVRRKRLSYASFALFCVLAAIFLMVFVRMHTEVSNKYHPPSTSKEQGIIMGVPVGSPAQLQQSPGNKNQKKREQ